MEIARLEGHKDFVTSLAVTADGTHIVNGSADKTALVWSLFASGQKLIDESKTVAPRCLPPQRYHLTLDPPLWCALSEKWPFDITSVVEPFIKEKQWQEAVAALDKAIKLVPTAAPRLGAQLDAIIKGERENIAAAALAGRHADALRMVEEIAGLVERPEVASDGKAGPATAMQLGNVAWHALFTAAHERALAAADRALELTPDRLWIVTNRAHALLFLGRVEKAKAVYLTHKGRKVPESDDAAWEQVITDDFAQLRKAGLAHSAMVEIEGVLTK